MAKRRRNNYCKKKNSGWEVIPVYRPHYDMGISFARNLQGLVIYGIIGETNVRNKVLNVFKLFLMGYLPLAFLYTLLCMLPQWLLDFRLEALNSFVYAPLHCINILFEILLMPIFSPMIAGWDLLQADKSDMAEHYMRLGVYSILFAIVALMLSRWVYGWLDRKCPNFYTSYDSYEDAPDFWNKLREKDARYVKALEIYKEQQLERLRRGE